MFTPTIAKIITYLRDTKIPKTNVELASIIDEEQQYVNKALERLMATDIIIKNRSLYYYNETPKSEEFATRLEEIYAAVDKKPDKDLLIRGLISRIPLQYMFHYNTLLDTLEREGFEREESRKFLENEIKKSYLKLVKLVYIGIEPETVPICIPPSHFYYLRHLGIIDRDGYKRRLKEYKDFEFHEQDYLLVEYPPEISGPAKEYVEKEMCDKKDVLRQIGMQTWKESIMRFYYW